MEEAMRTFLVNITGELQSAKYQGTESMYCRYSYHFGPDWSIVAGLDEGISQTTFRRSRALITAQPMSQQSFDDETDFVFNFPIDVTFRSSNAHGWPQLIVSVFGHDFLGRDVIRGYGSIYLPPTKGQHERVIRLFVPKSSTFLNHVSSVFSGRRPELVDPKIVAQSDGREVMRVESHGEIKVKFNVTLKDFRKFGYKC